MAVGAAVLAFVALLTVTQISAAATRRKQGGKNTTACATTAPATAKAPAASGSAAATGKAPASAAASETADAADAAAGDVPKANQTAGTVDGGLQNGRRVRNHVGDGQEAGRPNWKTVNPNCPTPTAANTSTTAPSTGGTLETLGKDCSQSRLQAHTGFQEGNRCVSTAFGEVSALAKNPTLLITRAPQRVRVGQAFSIQVSTRNLVRDRFLGAAAGGYYLESAFLTADGLTRGHFHSGCRLLPSTRVAPDPATPPAFFVATEDGGGSERPDVITINITGFTAAGTAQCASWAGDGSHRIPMMEKANEIPAFDSVRITVTN